MRYACGAICPCGTSLFGAAEHIASRKARYIAFAKQTYRIAESNISQKGTQMNNKSIKELAVELTVEITELCETIRAKAVFTNQLLRSCSSIGANAHEAKYAQSKADFISKLEISLKECYETEYWIEVLYRVGSLSEEQFKNVSTKFGKIRRKLIASITTAKEN